MASYKRLKGLAHNVAHSYFSVSSHVDGGFVVDELIQSARSAGISIVRLDLLPATADPPTLATPRVVKSLEIWRDHLPRWAMSEGCDFQAIKSFVLEAHFRFHDARSQDTTVEFWDFDASGIIVDDQGTTHVGSMTYCVSGREPR